MSKGFSGIFEDDKTTKINWNTILIKQGIPNTKNNIKKIKQAILKPVGVGNIFFEPTRKRREDN
jgi:hypothetical protein